MKARFRAFPGADLVPLVDTGSDGLERLALAYRADHALSAAEVQRALDASHRFPGLQVTLVARVPMIPLTQTVKADIKALRREIGLDRA